MFAQGQADAVAGYETMTLIGALLVLVLFGKIVWGKSTIRRRPVQREAYLALCLQNVRYPAMFVSLDHRRPRPRTASQRLTDPVMINTRANRV